MIDSLPDKVRVYGTSWCSDCQRARHWLDAYGVAYDEIDVDSDPAGLAIVKQINNGRRVVPTLIFPDGSVLVEPSNVALIRQLDPDATLDDIV